MFTPKTLEFIAENAFMNSKEWFTTHKDIYQTYVQTPMLEMNNVLTPVIEKIDPELITYPRHVISRIYRDARYAKGLLYREMFWLSYRRDDEAYPNYPEFYFVFTPQEYFYGCGYYMASPSTMAAMRELIKENAPVFLRAKEVYDAQTLFTIGGDLYKRNRHPDYPEELCLWLNRKNIQFAVKPSDIRGMFEENLAEAVSDAFRKMQPMYELMIAAETRARSLS